jgi:hypothetical protein
MHKGVMVGRSRQCESEHKARVIAGTNVDTSQNQDALASQTYSRGPYLNPLAQVHQSKKVGMHVKLMKMEVGSSTSSAESDTNR